MRVPVITTVSGSRHFLVLYKVQRLAIHREEPGIVLFGGVFYNYTYVIRLN
jgi:hypothetical protein